MPATAQHSPALQAALAAIAREFRHSHANHMARQWIAKSYGHPDTRARFYFFTQEFVARGLSLDEACEFVRGVCALPRASTISKELHLILRWLRAKHMHRDFADMVAAIREGARHQGELVAASSPSAFRVRHAQDRNCGGVDAEGSVRASSTGRKAAAEGRSGRSVSRSRRAIAAVTELPR